MIQNSLIVTMDKLYSIHWKQPDIHNGEIPEAIQQQLHYHLPQLQATLDDKLRRWSSRIM